MSNKSLVETASQNVVKIFFTTMSFGTELRVKRKAKNLSQEKLAALIQARGNVTCTGAYISNIERGYDKNKKGLPIKPNPALIEDAAVILDWNVNEALIKAGYAPLLTSEEFANEKQQLAEKLAAGVMASGFDEMNEDDQAAFLIDMQVIAERMIKNRIEDQNKRKKN